MLADAAGEGAAFRRKDEEQIVAAEVDAVEVRAGFEGKDAVLEVEPLRGVAQSAGELIRGEDAGDVQVHGRILHLEDRGDFLRRAQFAISPQAQFGSGCDRRHGGERPAGRRKDAGDIDVPELAGPDFELIHAASEGPELCSEPAAALVASASTSGLPSRLAFVLPFATSLRSWTKCHSPTLIVPRFAGFPLPAKVRSPVASALTVKGADRIGVVCLAGGSSPSLNHNDALMPRHWG